MMCSGMFSVIVLWCIFWLFLEMCSMVGWLVVEVLFFSLGSVGIFMFGCVCVNVCVVLN